MHLRLWLAAAGLAVSAAAYGQDRPSVAQDKSTKPASAVPQ